MKVKIKYKGYLVENIIDIVITLGVYRFFGFQVAVLVTLAMIMADVAMIMKRVYTTQDAETRV